MLALGLSVALYATGPGSSIGDFVDRELPASGAPGLAYAVVEGEVTTSGARGVLRVGAEEEVTPDTPFMTGSISKSFTALAVMQLVEAGSVDLDAEVSRYLDVFSGQPAESITIRQLLSHTSGYTTVQGNRSHEDTTGGEHELERRAAEAAAVAPARAPGSTWEYSNLNYQILGRLIEVVSGQEYQSYVETNILQPIGMEHSLVSDGEAHPRATGHLPWFGTKRPVAGNGTSRSTAPQGGIIASASDLARYMQVMSNGEDDVLSADGKAMMMRPAGEVSASYGFGWFVDAESGQVWHTGTSPGVETIATMIPAERKGVVVLVNAGSGMGFGETTELRTGITALGLGLDHEPQGGAWSRKSLFVGLTLAPVAYLLSIIWAWRKRDAIRAKSGALGLFSLWFPLVATLGAAWVLLGLVPDLFGVSMGTLRRFSPDFALVLSASALTGVTWAVLRLVVAHTGSSRVG